nr:hypothetical protein [Escherichia coli]
MGSGGDGRTGLEATVDKRDSDVAQNTRPKTTDVICHTIRDGGHDISDYLIALLNGCCIGIVNTLRYVLYL